MEWPVYSTRHCTLFRRLTVRSWMLATAPKKSQRLDHSPLRFCSHRTTKPGCLALASPFSTRIRLISAVCLSSTATATATAGLLLALPRSGAPWCEWTGRPRGLLYLTLYIAVRFSYTFFSCIFEIAPPNVRICSLYLAFFLLVLHHTFFFNKRPRVDRKYDSYKLIKYKLTYKEKKKKNTIADRR